MAAGLSGEHKEIRVPGCSKAFSVAMALLGTVGLILKSHLNDDLGFHLWSYGGNVTVSFAVYFVVGLLPQIRSYGKLAIAGAALLVAETFELADGFGVMSNVYDPVDLMANLLGVGLAFAVESLAHRFTKTQT